MDLADGGRSHGCDVAIVGGGCSGALVAAHLLRSGFSGEIAIIEMRSKLGHGLAYSTPFDQHLLNVPAGKMSAFPDQPDHFLDWLRTRNSPSGTAGAFAPRRVYGEYIEDVVETSAQATQGRSLRHVQAEVVDVSARPHGVTLALSDGSSIDAAKVVLALGNPASGPIDNSSLPTPAEHWFLSPWHGDALRVQFAGERILLVGAGLTAIDSALALHGHSSPCKTYMISRRGILPQVHDPRRTPSSPPSFEEPRNVRMMFRQLRMQIKELHERDGCWRTAVDSLRPISNELWRGLSLADQSRFQRHLKTYWETHRHRMAPEVRRRIDELRQQGKVEVIAGRVRESARKGEAIELTLTERRGGQRLLEVDRAINCTGILENYRKNPRKLIRRLIERGLGAANDLGIGFRTDEFGALIDQHGKPSNTLFTLGPPRRGEVFETTAVPEIRVQAEALARHLVRNMALAVSP